jgi:hypothetical protein
LSQSSSTNTLQKVREERGERELEKREERELGRETERRESERERRTRITLLCVKKK